MTTIVKVVSSGGDESGLELDSDCSCSTLGIYQILYLTRQFYGTYISVKITYGVIAIKTMWYWYGNGYLDPEN